VEQALEQASDARRWSRLRIDVADGVHRGSAAGFGGELVLDVTVEGGTISAIEVVESSETPFIADAAFKELIPAIVEAQGPVDAVSGAPIPAKPVLEGSGKSSKRWPLSTLTALTVPR